jgi:hypothetical protein
MNPGNFTPVLILVKARTPDLVVVQSTKEVHHEQRKLIQRQLLLRRSSTHGQRRASWNGLLPL